MQLGDVQVLVLCDGRPLEEFRVEEPDVSTVTCFVPSDAGKTFEVHTINSNGETPLVGKLRLDGFKVRTFRTMPNSVHVADCVYLSQSVRRPFIFSQTLSVQLDDDDWVRAETDLLDNIGTIQVDFYRCELGPELPWFSRGVKDIRLGQLPEGCSAHQATLGSQQYVRNKRVSGARATLLDPKDRPYARFIFRYQSKEILQAHRIIPTPPILPAPPNTDSRRHEARRHTLEPGLMRAIERNFTLAAASGRIARQRRRPSEQD